jgi:hypothetical protein
LHFQRSINTVRTKLEAKKKTTLVAGRIQTPTASLKKVVVLHSQRSINTVRTKLEAKKTTLVAGRIKLGLLHSKNRVNNHLST